MVKISVIIPAYNVENYIAVTLNSLLNQTSRKFEIVIVNDGSTDNTLNVINSIMEKADFHDFKLVNKLNGGVSSARNVGIQESSGDYLFFLDGDDYVSKDFIYNLEIELAKKDYDVIAWAFDTVREDKSIITHYSERYIIKKSEMTGFETLINCLENKLWIWTCSVLYRREIIVQNNLFYIEGCTNGEDQEFLFKVLINSKSVKMINKTLSFYVNRCTSITNTYNLKKFDSIDALDRAFKYIDSTKKLLNNDQFNYLKHYYLIDNFLAIFRSSVDQYAYLNSINKYRATEIVHRDMVKHIPRIYNNIIYNINKINNYISIKYLIKIITYNIFIINKYAYIGMVSLLITLRDNIMKHN